MDNYYAYFGLSKNVSILEVFEKLALFLTRTCEEANQLTDESEKKAKFNQALLIAQNVCKTFSAVSERNKCEEFISRQKVIYTRIYNQKESVPPIEDFYNKSKKSWARIIKCLIPSLEDEKEMIFLEAEDDILEIIAFVVENVEYYFAFQGISKNSYFVSLDIIKKSFDIAKYRKRDNVKIEDIVASINNCDMLGDYERIKLSGMVFDKWYKTERNLHDEMKKVKK